MDTSLHNQTVFAPSGIAQKKVALLLATGFEEKEFLVFQKFLRDEGAFIKLVSSDIGLVTSWSNEEWGHNYAVDIQLNKALAADFEMCLILGGTRSISKLGLSAHTRRFVSGFLASAKPVIVLNEANELISRIKLDGYSNDGHEAVVEQNNDSSMVSQKGSMIHVRASGSYDLTKCCRDSIQRASVCLNERQAA